MKKHYFSNIFTAKKHKLIKFLLLLAVILFSNLSTAQNVNVTSTGGTTSATYLTMSAAITAINTAVHTGTINCNVPANYSEAAPIGGYRITATGTLANPITFTKSTGVTVTFTANASLVAGSLTDAIFKIVGGDYITIDGYTMLENANTTYTIASNTMTEFGIYIAYASSTNGCNNITLKNNTITLNRLYANSFGIYANSTATETTPTTLANAGTGGGNNNLSITSNSISNVNGGIIVVGPQVAADHNDGLYIGGAATTDGNSITNYGGTGTHSFTAAVNFTVGFSYGIHIKNVKNYTVSNNIIDSQGNTTAGGLMGINVPIFNNAPTGNYCK